MGNSQKTHSHRFSMGDEEEVGPKYFYEGDKKDGDATLQHGKGKAIYKNSDEYEGEYQEGKRHGFGVYKWAKYEANEEEPDVMKVALDEEGKTVFQSTYTGQYVANLKEGEGVFEYPDGAKYQGEWRFGTKHGRGTFIHAESNARLVGTFADGKFVKGKWVMADSTYTGGYKDNKPFGPGEFVFKNGNVQDGEYLQKEPAEGEEDPEAPPLEPAWVGGSVTS